MRIDELMIEHIAALSCIKLSKEETEEFTRDINGIIQYMELLDELDLERMEPELESSAIRNVFRSDEKRKSLEVEEIMMNAPDRKGDFFRIRRVRRQR